MDESFLNSNGKISLKLSKDTNNHNWLINRSQPDRSTKNKRNLTKVVKKVPKKKISLKVSVPIRIWDDMQSNNKTNQTPHRLPSPSPQPTRLPEPSSPSLRMFRHPVPTSKGRTTLVDKYDQIVKAPKPIPPKTTFQSAIRMPLIPGDVPPATTEPAQDPGKNKTEDSNIVNKVKTFDVPCLPTSHSFESPLAIKHKLPFSVVPYKSSYSKKTINPINKENSTQTTAEQVTQTEKGLTVTEEEMNILEMVKNSSLTPEQLQDFLENCKEEKEKKNDDGLVIDLENDYEEDANDMYAKIMKHSTKNKSVLNEFVKLIQKNKDLPSQQSTPPPKTPSDSGGNSASSAEQQTRAAVGETADTLKPTINPHNFGVNDIQRAFAVSSILLQMGFRIVRIEPKTQGTQTEDHSNNKRRRLSSTADRNLTTELINPNEQIVQRPPMVPLHPSQNVPALVPLMQEMPVFQPPNPPRQSQQRQQYVSEHIEQAQLYPNMSAVIPHQRAQSSTSYHHVNTAATVVAHHPFENRSNTTSSTQQTQVQMPSQAQLHPHDPRRQGFNQMPISGHPHLSRVLGTQEANMHSQAQQGWTYPHYYDRQGNIYPQRLQ